MRFLDVIVEYVERVEKRLCALLVLAFSLLIVVNVGLRYFVSRPLYFAEELSVILMIWMAFIAASLTLGRREMVAVTFVTDLFSGRAGALIQLLVHLIVLMISAVFLHYSMGWILSPSSGRDMVITLAIPKWYPYLIVPVFFCLTTLKSLNNVAFHIAQVRK